MSEYILSHLRSPQMCIKEKQQMLVAPLVGAMAHRELTVSLPQPDPVPGECRGSFARCRRSPGEASLLVFLWGLSSADAFVPATRSCVLRVPSGAGTVGPGLLQKVVPRSVVTLSP